MPVDDDHIRRVIDSLSSKYWSWKYLTPEECPKNLYSVFAAHLTHIPLESWPARMSWGGVFINGLPVYENVPLTAPCRIEYYEPKYDFNNPAQQFPPFSKEYVLYNDGELALIFKPAGIPCFQAREQRKIYLKGQLEEHFNCKIHMPSRLDTSVSGLMAISLAERFHDQLQRVFEKRLIEKRYLLLVAGKPEWSETTVEGSIGRDMRHAVLRKVVEEGGKSATTQFRYLGSHSAEINGVGTELSLLEAKPITGRTHQIRIHSAHIGFPIVGDNFYGGLKAGHLHLLSYALKFKRPITGQEIDFCLPVEFIPSWVNQPLDNVELDLEAKVA